MYIYLEQDHQLESQVREDLRDHAPLGDDRDDPHRRSARADERIDFVDAADERGPVLPELSALGRVGLGGNRGSGNCVTTRARKLSGVDRAIFADRRVPVQLQPENVSFDERPRTVTIRNLDARNRIPVR